MPFILHQPVLLVQSDADGTGAVVDGAGVDDDTSVDGTGAGIDSTGAGIDALGAGVNGTGTSIDDPVAYNKNIVTAAKRSYRPRLISSIICVLSNTTERKNVPRMDAMGPEGR